MNRRTFLSALSGLAAARSIVAAAAPGLARVGLCSFSCHQHWKAVQAKVPSVKFTDALGFYRYSRSLGGQGVQTSLRGGDTQLARQFRARVEEDGGYLEGELRLPAAQSDVASFERDVRLLREAGVVVARAVFLGGRRYEVFQTLAEFRQFHARAETSLGLAEPILRQHRLKLALENHKDFTSTELAALMRRVDSEWVGVLVDTGNNLALMEEPSVTVTALAPWALSVHLKDMAVQLAPEGFLLSEVPLGTGALDLKRIVAALSQANPRIVFNLEMATRDPLRIPCRQASYLATFPSTEDAALRRDAILRWVEANPPRQAPPQVTGKEVSDVLAEEETNNRQGLSWMRLHVPA